MALLYVGLLFLVNIDRLRGQDLTSCMRSVNAACELLSGNSHECRVTCDTLQKIGNLLLTKINHPTCMDLTINDYIKMNVTRVLKRIVSTTDFPPDMNIFPSESFRLKTKLSTVFFPTDENIALMCS